MERASRDPQRVLSLSMWLSLALALICLAVLAATGRPGLGIIAVAGFAVGVVNNRLADRLVTSGIPFLATSGVRLLGLTVIGLGVFLAFRGFAAVAFLGGVGGAQFALSVAAVREGLR